MLIQVVVLVIILGVDLISAGIGNGGQQTGLTGPWGQWSACSHTCGGGTQTRLRWKIDENKQNVTETRRLPCKDVPCEVLTRWLPWDECDKECGGGHRNRKLKDVGLFDNRTMSSWDFRMSCNNNKCNKTASCEKFDLIFLLDSSGSIGESGWWRVKQLAIDVVRSMKVGRSDTRIGLVTYSSSPRLEFDLNQFRTSADVEAAIWRSDFQGGNTGTADGIQEVNKAFNLYRGDRPSVQNVLVWMTDGESNIDAERTIPEAIAAKDAGINIIAIGVGYSVKMSEINAVASHPARLNAMHVKRIGALQGILPSLSGGVCKGPTSFTYRNSAGFVCCTNSAQVHTRTFDGSWVHYNGQCKYNLATPHNGQFKVLVRQPREEEDASKHYIEVVYNNNTYRLRQDGILQVNGKEVQLPHRERNGTTVWKKGRELVARLPDYFEVRYDGTNAITVCVHERYEGDIEGLCGNYDGDRFNDFVTRQGKKADENWKGYTLVGDSWQVPDPENPKCENKAEKKTCSVSNELIAKGPNYCGVAMDQKGPFSECLGRVPADGHLDSCMYDVCSHVGNATLMTELSCQSLLVFARECRALGVQLGPWYRMLGCPSWAMEIPPELEETTPATEPTTAPAPKSQPYYNAAGMVCCTHSGDPHIRRWDGSWLHYQGQCKYNLATPKNEEFKVEVKHEMRHGHKYVSYPSYVEVTYKGTRIRLARGNILSVNGVPVLDLPYVNGNLTIRMGKKELIVTIPGTLELTYNGDNRINTCIDTRFRNQMTGLCGDYNGDMGDDFVTRLGVEVDEDDWKGHVAIGDSWQVADVEDPSCQNAADNLVACSSEAERFAREEEYCGLMINMDGPFGNCLKDVPYKGYMDSCVFDVCSNSASATLMKQLACNALEVLEQECKDKRFIIGPWRNFVDCRDEESTTASTTQAPTTPMPESPTPTVVITDSPSVPTAPQSQGRKDQGGRDQGNKDQGTKDQGSKDQGAKGPTQQPPHKETIFQYITDEGYTCCSSSGDPHIRTLDGSWIHYQGVCKYNLATPTSEAFKVEVKHEMRHHNQYVSYPQYVEVTYQGHVFRLEKGAMLKVDGSLVTLPYSRAGVLGTVSSDGKQVKVNIPGVLEATYDSRRIRVCVSSDYKDQMTGLCGNFDGFGENDFSTKQGVPQPDTWKGHIAIGDSWQVEDPDNPGCQNSADDYQPCTWENELEAMTAEYCGLMMNNHGPFGVCLERVPSRGYAASCIQDVCMNSANATLQKELSCDALTVMEEECASKGIKVGRWKHFLQCPIEEIRTTKAPTSPTPAEESGATKSPKDVKEAKQKANRELQYEIIDGQGDQERGFGCCTTSGDPHTRQFDNRWLHYQGICKYNMATPNDNAFQVVVRHERRHSNAQVSYPRYVEVVFHNRTHRLDKGKRFTVNGVSVPLPYERAGVRVTMEGNDLVLNIPGALEVRFDGTTVVRVCVNMEYRGKMTGLCGNFDGNPDNDMVTKEGVQQTDDWKGHIEIGDSWQVRDPEDPNCDNAASSLTACSLKSEQKARNAEYCGLIRNNHGPFGRCLDKIPSKGYADACILDVCTNSNNATLMKMLACNSLVVMEKECNDKGITVEPWRHYVNCPPVTTEVVDTDTGDQGGEQPVVVPPSPTPPAAENIVEHPPFQTEEGLVCCQAIGDPHYRMIDGGWLHYQGVCKYNMASPSNGEFQVEIRTEMRHTHPYVSYPRYIEITYDGYVYRLGRNNIFYVNGIRTPLPYRRGLLTVTQEGKYLILRVPGALEARYDGIIETRVCVHQRFRTIMTGLCGNFNGNREDDYTTKNGVRVTNDWRGHIAVGDSWQVPDSENPNCTGGPKYYERCTQEAEKEAMQAEYCGLMQNNYGPFGPCFYKVPRRGYAESCIVDVCSNANNKTLQKELACAALEIFADECKEKGIIITDWRWIVGCEVPRGIRTTLPPRVTSRRQEVETTTPRTTTSGPGGPVITPQGFTCCASTGGTVRMFDTGLINYRGECKYNLATPSNASFRVEIRHEKREGSQQAVYPRYVELTFNQYTFRIYQSGTFTVNGEPFSIPRRVNGITVGRQGQDVFLEIPGALEIKYNGDRVRTCVHRRFYAQMTGLCGNFNGNAADDYVTKDGRRVSNNFQGHIDIGNSWQVTDSEDPRCVGGAEEIRGCSDEQRQKASEVDYCGLIVNQGGPFGRCIAISSTKDTMESCIQDYCNEQTEEGKKIAACKALAALEEECKDRGVVIQEDWRRLLNCPEPTVPTPSPEPSTPSPGTHRTTPGTPGPSTTPSYVNPCQPNPCVNGGSCVIRDADFICICPVGYSGDRCEKVPELTPWTNWSRCSLSCGGGARVRTRSCTWPGQCPPQPLTEEQLCNNQRCPTEDFTPWSDWSTCTVTCEGGTRTRTRSCTRSPSECPNLPLSQTMACNQQMCRDERREEVTPWSDWTTCSLSCGGGTHRRTRSCIPPGQCPNLPLSEDDTCNTQPCPRQDFTPWSDWSTCSVSCGGGTSSRTRSCTRSPAECQGLPVAQDRACNPEQCPAEGVTPWSRWSSCTLSCGGGTRSRSRSCTRPAACPGLPLSQEETCNTQECPTQDFTPWSDWSRCSVSCGGGVRSRTRSCRLRPSECPQAPVMQSVRCNTQQCPSEAVTPWSDWSTCSLSCGGGTRSRSRSCIAPGPCQLPLSEDGTCNTQQCPRQDFTPWSDWSTCTVTCGRGTSSRTRSCTRRPAECPNLPLSQNVTCNAQQCPREVVTTWSDWSTCSLSCGGGTRNRTRSCVRPGNCPRVPLSQAESCNTQLCPEADFTPWSDWSTCSVSCGEGTHSRTRSCTLPPSQCPRLPLSQQVTCYALPCPSEGAEPTPWSDWSACSLSCGGGTRIRTRSCPRSGFCRPFPLQQDETCNSQQCTRKDFSPWTDWSVCTATCEGGVRSRTRSCILPSSAECPRLPLSQNMLCNAQPCPRTGPDFTPWSEWSACSLSCGGGTHKRTRSCTRLSNCPRLPLSQQESCNTQRCPTEDFTPWSVWSTCSVTCGGGTSTRTRSCIRSPADCPRLPLSQNKTCNTQECPRVGPDFTTWSDWSSCSLSCGGGTRNRTRSCTRPLVCPRLPLSQSETCNVQPCPTTDADFTPWSDWSTCTATCGGGNRSRARSCTRRPAECPSAPLVQNVKCNTQPCPSIGPDFTPWSDWSTCSLSCGGGTRSRTRSCTRAPYCPGLPLSEDETCNTQLCGRQDFTDWTAWSPCSLTCGAGTQTRTRICTRLPANCPRLPLSQNILCNTQPCPIEDFTPWSDWTTCSLSCGGGTRSRTRACIHPPSCPRLPLSEDETCNTQQCPREDFTPWSVWSPCTLTCGGGTRSRTRECTRQPSDCPNIPVSQYAGCNTQPCERGAIVEAVCEIMPDSGIPDQAIQGTVRFTQSRGGGPVTVSVDVTGFDASDNQNRHGFHIHVNPQLGNQCTDAGGHYNPDGVRHGGPKDSVRHVGDLGNVDEVNGVVRTSFGDSVISLRPEDGARNVIGRSIVIHRDEDDLGRGGFQDSGTTGHAGPRLGCCVINPSGVTPQTTPQTPATRRSTTPRGPIDHTQGIWPTREPDKGETHKNRDGLACCTTTGDPHYRMIDGKWLHYQGVCKYNMATPKIGPFKVEIKHEMRNGHSGIAYPQYLEVTYEGVVYRLGKNNVLTINGTRVYPPYERSGVRIFIQGNTLILQIPGELEVSFDGNNRARACVADIFYGKMTGLCGNYDGDGDNDFVTKQGHPVSDSWRGHIAIGDSWQVPDPENMTCVNGPDKPIACTEEEQERAKNYQYCGLMLNPNGPFGECIQTINVTGHQESCIEDVCQNYQNRTMQKEQACNALETLEVECIERGFNIEKWRWLNNCPPRPEIGNITELVSTKSPLYPDEVNTRGPNVIETEQPRGTDKDVIETEQPRGTTRPRAERGGTTIRTIPRPTKPPSFEMEKGLVCCTGSGDPHYRKFDRGWLHYQGICKYNMATTYNGDFSVEVKHEMRNDNRHVSYPKYVDITYKSVVYRLDKGRKLLVNGQEQSTVYVLDDVTVTRTGSEIIFFVPGTITVKFDGSTRVRTCINKRFMNEMTGLCGNFDGNMDNDYVTKFGKKVANDWRGHIELGDSWQVDDPEEPNCTSQSKANYRACTEEAEQLAKTASYCGLMMNNHGPFGKCISGNRNLTEGQAQACLLDVCSNDGDKALMKGLSCNQLIVLERECNEDGFKVDGWWRRFIGCPEETVDTSAQQVLVPDTPEPTTVETPSPTPPTTTTAPEVKDFEYVNEQGFSCCTHSGDPHTQMFDGKWIHYQGQCKYNLASPNDGSFKVEVKHERRVGERNIAMPKYLEITYKSMVYKIDQGRRFTVNDIETKVPHNHGQVTVTYAWQGKEVMITIKGMLEATFDGNNRMRVCVHNSYKGKMTGLCGNMDKDGSNDMVTKEGKQETDDWKGHVAIGDSWQVVDQNNPACISGAAQYRPCSKESDLIARTVEYCGLLMNNHGPFGKCLDKIQGVGHARACVLDVCGSAGSVTIMKELSCNALTVVERECKDKGLPVDRWRHFTQCEEEQPRPVTLTPSPPSTQNQVTARPAPEKFEYVTEEGFGCCVHSGDPHTQMFDGGWLNYQGRCRYNLASTNNRLFMVEVKHETRGVVRPVPFPDYVEVLYKGKIYRLTKSRTLLVDNDRVQLPYSRDGVTVSMEYGDITLSLLDYMEVRYDGINRVRVCVDGKFKSKMQGLCGNFDGDRQNDFVTKTGTPVPDTWRGHIAIGDSWQVPDQENPRCENGADLLPPCTRHAEAKAKTADYCGLMMNKRGPFASCLANVGGEGHLNACILDVCSAEGEGEVRMKNVSCRALMVLERECLDRGWPVDKWRYFIRCPEAVPVEPEPTVPSTTTAAPVCTKQERRRAHDAQYCGLLINRHGPYGECLDKIDSEKYVEKCIVDVCSNLGHLELMKELACDALHTVQAICEEKSINVYPWNYIVNCPRKTTTAPSPSTTQSPEIHKGGDTMTRMDGRGRPVTTIHPDLRPRPPGSSSRQTGKPGYSTRHPDLQPGPPAAEASTRQPGDQSTTLHPDLRTPHPDLGYNTRGQGSHGGRHSQTQHPDVGGPQRGQNTTHPDLYGPPGTRPPQDGGPGSQTIGGSSRTGHRDRSIYTNAEGLVCCTHSGDPHTRMFDGAWLHYQGFCKYNLASPREGPFKVAVRHEVRNNNYHVSYPSYVEVEYRGSVYRLMKDRRLQVDGVEIDLQVPFVINGVNITYEPGHVIMKIPDTLEVQFDGDKRMKVCISRTYQSQMTGLCGNFDGNWENDYVTSDGRMMQNNWQGHILIGNSWQVTDPEDSTCTNRAENYRPCSMASQNIAKTAEYCGVLLNSKGPFSSCLESVDVHGHVESCIQDVCSHRGTLSIQKELACSAIYAAELECKDKGFRTQPWRHFLQCPAPPGMPQATTPPPIGKPENLQKFSYINEEGFTCCTHSGDPHTRTFDGSWLHYQGACKYNLATPTDGPFKVEVKHEIRHGNRHVSYSQYVEVVYNGRTYRMEKGKLLKVNGIAQPLPYSRGGVVVTRRGDDVALLIPGILEVSYNGENRIRTCVQELFRSRMTGLCGNFDGNATNDFVNSRGGIESDNWRGHIAVGDSWQVHDPEDRSCSTGAENYRACSPENEDHARNIEYCGLMLNRVGPFMDCLNKIPSQGHQDACILDVCSNSASHVTMKELSCQAMATMEKECKDAGVSVGAYRKFVNCPEEPTPTTPTTEETTPSTVARVAGETTDIPPEGTTTFVDSNDWGDWGPCSTSCGTGFKQRVKWVLRLPDRKWMNVTEKASCSGMFGSCAGVPPGALEPRSTPETDVGGTTRQPTELRELAPWSEWSACTVTCGVGVRERQHSVLDVKNNAVKVLVQRRWCAAPSCEGGATPSRSPLVTSSTTFITPPPQDAEQATPTPPSPFVPVEPWSKWSQCTASCGRGIKERYRWVRNLKLSTVQMVVQRTICVSQQCKATTTVPPSESRQSGFSEMESWGRWSTCTVTCGVGMQERSRRLYNSVTQSTKTERMRISCKLRDCPVAKKASTRLPLSPLRQRSTVAPNTADITADYIATDAWSNWAPCSVTCGLGIQQRYRWMLHKIRKTYRLAVDEQECKGRLQCPGSTNKAAVPIKPKYMPTSPPPKPTSAGDHTMPPDYEEAETWAAWSACTVTCGTGIRERYRWLVHTIRKTYRLDIQRVICRHSCPVDWGQWGAWSDCSVTCGFGTRYRFRNCKGSGCQDQQRDKETCLERLCPSSFTNRGRASCIFNGVTRWETNQPGHYIQIDGFTNKEERLSCPDGTTFTVDTCTCQ